MRRLSACLVVHLAVCVGVAILGMQAAHANSDRYIEAVSQFRAERALMQFAALPPARRDAVRASLWDHLHPVDAWVRELDRSAPSILCLGETHNQPARRFVAEQFFPYYHIDRLLLETSPAEARRIALQVEGGAREIGLLGVDIGAAVIATKGRNPRVRIDGLEGVGSGRSLEGTRVEESLDRERALAERFWVDYEPGTRHVLLYGGLHCADWSLWMFHHLVIAAPDARARGDLWSVRLLARDHDASTLAFARFATRFGLPAEDLVIADTAALAPELRRWFPLFNQTVLGPFDAVVIHGPEPRPSEQVAGGEGRATPAVDAVFPHWSAGGVTRKPETGDARATRSPRWLKPGAVRKPSTADIDLTPHGDLFPHPRGQVTARKPSTGAPLHEPRREGDFPHGIGP